MLKISNIVAQVTIALLPALPLAAQAQNAPSPAPPGPYQAMPERAQPTAMPALIPTTQPQHQAPQVQATQLWGAPRGMAMPYWMQAPAQNMTNTLPSGASGNNAQSSPAATPAPASNPASQATLPYGMQVAPGFYPGYGGAQMQTQMQASGTGFGNVQRQSQNARQNPGQAASTYPSFGGYGMPAPNFPGYQPFPNYSGYGTQAPMPYWNAPAVPYYPGYQPGYRAPAQVRR